MQGGKLWFPSWRRRQPYMGRGGRGGRDAAVTSCAQVEGCRGGTSEWGLGVGWARNPPPHTQGEVKLELSSVHPEK